MSRHTDRLRILASVLASLTIVLAGAGGMGSAAASAPPEHPRPFVAAHAHAALFPTLDSAAPGGTFSFLIPFQFDASAGCPCTLHVTLPAPLVPKSAPGGTISGPSVTWSVPAVTAAAGTGGILTLTAYVPAATAPGTTVTADLDVRAGGTLLGTSSSGTLTVGPVLHLPFFKGYPDGLFRPGRLITRAELAAVVTRIEGLVPSVPGPQRFSDVPPTSWAFPYVQAAAKAKWVVGYPDGTLRPNVPATRAQFALILVRMAAGGPVVFGPLTQVRPLPFVDVASTNAYAPAIATVQGMGLMHAVSGNLFAPACG